MIQKLSKIQAELKAPKSQYNSFGKYYYRNAEDILEAVKPLLHREGIILTITDEPVVVGDWHYIKATATVTDGTTSFSVSASAREASDKKGMDESQITGTASSYARKYALNGLFCIDDTKDADNFNNQPPKNTTGSATEKRDKVIASGVAGDDFKVLMAQASGLKEMCQNLDMPAESLSRLNAAYAGIKSIEDATVFIRNAEATCSKYPEKSSFQDDKIPF